MNRRHLREWVFKLLFRIEFNDMEDMEEQIQLFFEDEEIGEIADKDRAEITDKYRKIVEHLKEIDEIIDAISSGWTISRMAKVDLTIIRLAVYEMRFDENIPTSVAINEAVEISKKFGGDDSPAFVNGVLAKAVE